MEIRLDPNLGGERVFIPPVGFPYWYSAAFSNFRLETFLPNLVSLTCPILQVLDDTHTGVFPISRFLVYPLSIKIDMTPESVMMLTWNLDQWLSLARETRQCQKKLTMTICQQVMTSSILFFIYGQFWAIWMPVPRRTVCDCYILINSNHLSYKK